MGLTRSPSRSASPGGRGPGTDVNVRVLHVFGRLDRGGAELRTLDVLRATVNEPIRHEFICLSGLVGVLDDDFREVGAVIHHIGLDWRFPYRLLRLLRNRRIDLLHSHVHFFSGGLLVLAFLARVPRRIVHFRSTHDGQPDTPVRQVFRTGQRLLIRCFATDILAVTTGAMDAWDRNWRSDPRCRVVLNGIDPDIFLSAISAPLNRGELGVGEDGPIVAFVGRFDPVKRPEMALRSFALMRGHPWLVCAGSVTPEHRASFTALAVELGVGTRVVVLGLRDDVARLFALADVAVMTSSFEGLPGVVLEALATGAPVVASRLPGTIEISHYLDGVTLVDPAAEPSEWADSLDAALNRDWGSDGSLSTRALRHEAFCRSPFTVEHAARELTEIWLGAARHNTRNGVGLESANS